MEYKDFILKKSQLSGEFGFSPTFMPDMLFDFQKALVEWSVRKGRTAIFADCGLGKTPIQLVWAENISRHTNGKVLILTPLSVSSQTVLEGEKFGIEVKQRREGIFPSDKIIVTNYERLHYFNPSDFEGVVCDESSILKNPEGFTKESIIEFSKNIKYRLLCTATAAPNDFIELGTSSEALGYMGFRDMISQFFKKSKSTYSRKEEYGRDVWKFRGHAKEHFWRWVCSWARAIRTPSDMGFDNDGFVLPQLLEVQHTVKAKTLPDGFLFELPAVGLSEQRNELRRTIQERCEKVAELVKNDEQSVVWCNLNEEGQRIEKLINGAVNVEGNDSEEFKEESFKAFKNGDIRVLVSKPSIAGFGLNWQHCHHMTFFPSHSYEQYYQSVRRCWRFGQTKNVKVDIVSTEGQNEVLKNLQRKAKNADEMFSQLVKMMWNELSIIKTNQYTKQAEVPSWL